MSSSPPPLAVIVLAAGKGTRMHSSLAKVLHPLAGRALLTHVLDVATHFFSKTRWDRFLLVPRSIAAREVDLQPQPGDRP